VDGNREGLLLLSRLEGLGRVVNSRTPSGVCGGVPAETVFGAF